MIDRLKAGLYRRAFAGAGKLGTCDIKDAIVIAGSPRSGTTLLLEVIQAHPDYKAVNEPLLRKRVRDRQGFEYRTYLDPSQDAPQQHAFLRDVLTGRVSASARWSLHGETALGQLVAHATTNKMLVKFCRINRMLLWFADRFPVLGTVLIVRHPCAVVSSMMRWGNWDSDYIQTKGEPGSLLYTGHLPDAIQAVFAPVLDRISSQAEALATVWCLDHYIPLLHYERHPWILVPYERLLTRGDEELGRITHALGIEATDDMVRLLQEPSSSTQGHLAEDAEIQLSTWKDRLSRQHIDEILSVVEEVGLGEIYSSDPHPSYHRLNLLQNPAWRWTLPAPPSPAS